MSEREREWKERGERALISIFPPRPLKDKTEEGEGDTHSKGTETIILKVRQICQYDELASMSHKSMLLF